MVTYFKVIIIKYFYLYRLIEKYSRKCIYEALPEINIAVWYLYAMEHFINALIYYNKYFGSQILPFAELFVFSSNTRGMTHIAPVELLD